MKEIFIYIILLFFISCNNNSASIFITPSEIIHGDNIDIKILGLIENTKYEVYLTSVTLKEGVVFLSKAIFYSDKTGKIDIDKGESIGGSFLGKDSLGLFYKMDTTSRYPNVLKFNDVEQNDYNLKRRIQVVRNNKLICTKDFTLVFYDKKATHTHIEKGDVILDLYSHENTKNDIVLFFGGSEGNNKETKKYAQIFSSLGFNTAAISYFGNEKQGYHLCNIPLERIDSSIFQIENIIGKLENIVLLGTSKGAELTLLYASLRKKINAVIAIAPSSHVFQGISNEIECSSWSLNEEEIKYIAYPKNYINFLKFSKTNKIIFKDLYDKSLELNDLELANIQVEKIKGDILLFSGENDEMWNSKKMADIIESRLLKNDFQYNIYNYQYINVGHYVGFNSYSSTEYSIRNSRYEVGGSVKDCAYANLKNREIIINFLTNKLKHKN